EMDDPLRLGRVMQSAVRLRRRKDPLIRQQACQRQAAESVADRPQEVPPTLSIGPIACVHHSILSGNISQSTKTNSLALKIRRQTFIMPCSRASSVSSVSSCSLGSRPNAR